MHKYRVTNPEYQLPDDDAVFAAFNLRDAVSFAIDEPDNDDFVVTVDYPTDEHAIITYRLRNDTVTVDTIRRI